MQVGLHLHADLMRRFSTDGIHLPLTVSETVLKHSFFETLRNGRFRNWMKYSS